jgi:calcineurin-like phosphoesterase family protein
MAQIWLISDTHLFHRNFLKFTDADGEIIRPFSDVTTMNDLIRERWNSTVKPQDHVYHLGDVALQCSATLCKEFIQSLNGKKRLVRGNHDRFTARQYIEMGFQEIHGLHNLFNVWLTHAPIHPSNIGRMVGNAHGHIHERVSPEGPYLNCSVEATNYFPVDFDAVKKLLVVKRGAWERQGLLRPLSSPRERT